MSLVVVVLEVAGDPDDGMLPVFSGLSNGFGKREVVLVAEDRVVDGDAAAAVRNLRAVVAHREDVTRTLRLKLDAEESANRMLVEDLRRSLESLGEALSRIVAPEAK